MIYDRMGVIITLVCCAVCGSSAALEDSDATEVIDNCSLWKPGMRYQTRITYDFTVKNCEIKVSKGYDVENGAFTSPQISFRPIVEYVTEDIRRKGHNYFGMRTYKAPVVTLRGVQNLRWATTSSLVNPKRWFAWFVRMRNEDLSAFTKMEDENQATEEYLPFILSNESKDQTNFNPAKEALYLEWTDRTFIAPAMNYCESAA